MKSAVLLGVCFFAFCSIKATSCLRWNTVKAYYYYSSPKSYDAAQAYCRGLGAILAEPLNSKETAQIANLIPEGNAAYIGFNDRETEGSFVSSSGEKMCFSNWYTNEPNNAGNEDCVEINFGQRQYWNDVPCKLELTFVCQKNY